MKKVAILQSNYIPWKGYFDLIAYVDEFIIYDDMQFTKNDWRNRNKVKTPQGLMWVTIPVGSNINRKINEVIFSDNNWREKHCKILEMNYKKSKYFKEVFIFLEPIILDTQCENLSVFNTRLIQAICNYLNINTKITFSSDYGLVDGKTERLVDLCTKTHADIYVSGPAAKDYIDESLFVQKNISLEWFQYDEYIEYPQLWEGFDHQVTILDLLFNCGPDSIKYMRYTK